MSAALIRWFMVALMISVSTAADAQRRRIHRAAPRARIEALQLGFSRPPATVLQPSGDGIIHWNTPNKDGNLGGPGTGGGGGGGG
ncbi:hypothetical protein LOK46_21180 [Methylobacterium sp. NMS14P]|uniref:hypothetical protein n=1 Tax=Methylobacterium sp. NMS14P TaxID=2894310 RepID=UPI00235A15D6|nr:hypothetical protein [Methylobacterium sp. NMS14P]WCS23658.1 hypothetical protein LOK46_21180 [Methylobacterium sp. NMS14P]